MIKIVFFGSPVETVPVLEKLVEDSEIAVVAVVTQPDRPVGRKKVMTPTPVAGYATVMGLRVLKPVEFDEKFYFQMKNIANEQQSNKGRHVISKTPTVPLFGKEGGTTSKVLTKQQNYETAKIDVAILAAYGAILPHQLLELPEFGFLNLHPSLLPKYRGASPCVPPILKGEKTTGLTIMQMDAALDHGPIVTQFEEEVRETDTHRSLEERLFKKGAEILPEVVKAYIKFQISNSKNTNKKLNITDSNEISRSTTIAKFKNYSQDLAYSAKDQARRNDLQLFLPPKEQEHEKASFTKLLKKEDGYVPWESVGAALGSNTPLPSNPPAGGVGPSPEGINAFSPKLQPFLSDYNFPDDLPVVIERMIRALAPWPGAWTQVQVKEQRAKSKEQKKQKLKLLSAHLEEIGEQKNRKTEKQKNNWKRETGNSKLVLNEVRLEGKKTMEWREFGKIYLDKC